MAGRDEITSTEKLLTLIRGDEKATGGDYDPPSSPPTQSKGASVGRTLSFRRALTVGVEVTQSRLRLVKAKAVSEGRWQILDRKEVPWGKKAVAEDERLHVRLREVLSGFCGSGRRPEIWAQLDCSTCEIRRLEVPKVPRRRLSQAVFWALKNSASFDDREMLFDYRVLGQAAGEDWGKTTVLAFTFAKDEVKNVKELFARSGFPLAGLTPAPFTAENLFRGLPQTQGGLCGLLHVGDVGSRIDIFSSGTLVFSRSVRTSMASLFGALMAGLGGVEVGKRSLYLEAEEALVSDNEDEWAYGEERALEALSLLEGVHPAQKGGVAPALNPKDVLRLVLPPVERLVRQVALSFTHFSQTAGQRRVERMCLSGGVSAYKPLVLYIQDRLGIPVEVLDSGSFGERLQWVRTRPPGPGEMGRLLPALGGALSNRGTPSLFFTYAEREKLARVTYLNRGIFVGFLLMMAVCLGVFFWQEEQTARKQSEIGRLFSELNRQNPRVTRGLIQDSTALVEKKLNMLQACADRYRALGVVQDVAKKTPEHVRLMDLRYSEEEKTEGKEKKTVKNLRIEGYVLGDPRSLDIQLAAYLASLGESVLLDAPVLDMQETRYLDGKTEVKYFVAHLGVS